MKHLALPLLFVAGGALSLPFNPVDIRAISMGGTGVASAKPAAAAEFNPALLSHYDDEKHGAGLVFFNLSGSLGYSQDARSAIEDIQDEDYIDNISTAIDDLNRLDAATFGDSADLFDENVKGFTANLGDIAYQPINVGINVAPFAVSIPDKTFGFSVFASSTIHLQTLARISDCDLNMLNAFADFVVDLEGDPSNILETESVNVSCSERDNVSVDLVTVDSGSGSARFNDVTQGVAADGQPYLLSSAEVAAMAVTDLGLAMSHERMIKDIPVSFGFTPKLQSVAAVYLHPTVQSVNDGSFDVENQLTEERIVKTQINADAGFAIDPFKDDSLTVGLVVKNILPYSYEPRFRYADGGYSSVELSIDPQIRAGVSFQKNGWVITSDLDLVENKPLFYGDGSQMLSFGGEYDIANKRILTLRGGARLDMKGTEDSTLSAGVALNLFAFHVDFGAEFGDEYLAGGLQVGFDFR